MSVTEKFLADDSLGTTEMWNGSVAEEEEVVISLLEFEWEVVAQPLVICLSVFGVLLLSACKQILSN